MKIIGLQYITPNFPHLFVSVLLFEKNFFLTKLLVSWKKLVKKLLKTGSSRLLHQRTMLFLLMPIPAMSKNIIPKDVFLLQLIVCLWSFFFFFIVDLLFLVSGLRFIGDSEKTFVTILYHNNPKGSFPVCFFCFCFYQIPTLFFFGSKIELAIECPKREGGRFCSEVRSSIHENTKLDFFVMSVDFGCFIFFFDTIEKGLKKTKSLGWIEKNTIFKDHIITSRIHLTRQLG
jgi:hypothetical protein